MSTHFKTIFYNCLSNLNAFLSAVFIYNFEYGKKLTKTCLLKTAISSLNDSDEQTSPPATPGSRGVHVASSHFSNISANNGNRGCLKTERSYLCKQPAAILCIRITLPIMIEMIINTIVGL